MAMLVYTPRPFNPLIRYPNQVKIELEKANDNFEILEKLLNSPSFLGFPVFYVVGTHQPNLDLYVFYNTGVEPRELVLNFKNRITTMQWRDLISSYIPFIASWTEPYNKLNSSLKSYVHHRYGSAEMFNEEVAPSFFQTIFPLYYPEARVVPIELFPNQTAVFDWYVNERLDSNLTKDINIALRLGSTYSGRLVYRRTDGEAEFSEGFIGFFVKFWAYSYGRHGIYITKPDSSITNLPIPSADLSFLPLAYIPQLGGVDFNISFTFTYADDRYFNLYIKGTSVVEVLDEWNIHTSAQSYSYLWKEFEPIASFEPFGMHAPLYLKSVGFYRLDTEEFTNIPSAGYITSLMCGYNYRR